MLVILSATVMLMNLSVAITQVIVSVTIKQLEVPAAFMQVKLSAANMWMIIFIEMMQVGGLCCNYASGIFCNALCTLLFLL